MDKTQAKRIMGDIFENSFDRERFCYFIINLLNLKSDNILEATRTYGREFIPKTYQEYIESIQKIANYRIDEKEIDILITRLKKQTSAERARAMQRNFIAWYLEYGYDRPKDAALAAFVSPNEDDWRFSLVKMDYTLNQDKDGRVGAKKILSPAKRWSFLAGSNQKSQIAQVQLLDIVQKDDERITLEQLEEAFSIEKVTKEFFEKYRELLFKTDEVLDKIISKDLKVQAEFEGKNIKTLDFAKKLLGQIVFLYFLQGKGWFGVSRDADWGTGPKNFLRELFEGKHGQYNNFYNDVLGFLFYDALRNNRSHNDNYYPNFNCKIPFLNGGLFDPINDYGWVHKDILFPNELFSNNKITKEGDTGDGILDVFDRYNFTVKEDEPLEKEVAVDPEMLGKVFENLLEIKDRKSKGTYYTPRKIVHYMCKQSLMNYLETELKGILSKGDVGLLVNAEGKISEDQESCQSLDLKLSNLIGENSALIDDKLASVKVCDPAVGSGAFLVGMMAEIIRIRNILSNYINDPERANYNLKRECIENSLYGVDIDPGAVEICKLRLWLSLVVDEEDIKPLPNLDYKIVCGNSLLGVEINLFNQKAFNKLEKLKPIYFSETDVKKKNEYKYKIDGLIEQITDGRKEFDFEVYFSEVFHEKNGFDILITNPPYVGEKGNKNIFRTIKKGPLGKYYQGKMDIFYFFFHLALNIGKKNSTITFITTNYYTTASGAIKLRKDFKQRAIIKDLINFNELKIFDSALGQHNMITILQKAQDIEEIARTVVTRKQGIIDKERLQNILNRTDNNTIYSPVIQKDLYDGQEQYIRLSGDSGFSENTNHRILNKIKGKGELLGKICNINQGIVTGADKVSKRHIEKYGIDAALGQGIFVLSKEEIQYFKLGEQDRKILKPWFKNSDIYPWHAKKISQETIIYVDRDSQITENVLKHLQRFKTPLLSRREVKKSVIEWWQLQWPRKSFIFQGAKIIAPQRSKFNIFGYSEGAWYASADVYFITGKDDSFSLKYILALLNSKLYWFWLYHRGKRKGESLELYQVPLSEIPIKNVRRSEQKKFIDIVNCILDVVSKPTYDPKHPPYKQKELEKLLSHKVYKLYGLTGDEIKIVEKSIGNNN